MVPGGIYRLHFHAHDLSLFTPDSFSSGMSHVALYFLCRDVFILPFESTLLVFVNRDISPTPLIFFELGLISKP